MTYSELGDKWAHEARLLLQTLCRLTSEDCLTWQFTFNGTDCEHSAVYGGKKLRLSCCDPKFRQLFIDDQEIGITNTDAGVLCNEVTKQRCRLDLIHRTTVIAELNQWLNGEQSNETVKIQNYSV